MEIQGKNGRAKVFTELIEETAYQQIKNLMDEPITENSRVRVMPDVHAGKGSTVGTTIRIKNDLQAKVSPNVVGVDIGCGISAVRLEESEIDYQELDKIIRQSVPSGFKTHKRISTVAKEEAKPLLDNIKTPLKNKDKSHILKSVGTLGGGNHYIELAQAEDGTFWLSVHSGSRNLGVRVCNYWQAVADQKRHHPQASINYLMGADLEGYLNDMKLAQKYASLNRQTMLDKIIEMMDWKEPSYSINSIHNFIDIKEDELIIRKGATKAEAGHDLIIPINMRDGTLLAKGKGNSDWNYSAPHGAGRQMSRTQAKKTLDLSDYKKQMTGIYTTSVSEKTLDEAPDAYKPLDNLLDNIADTVEIIEQITPVYNFKAN